MESTPAALLKSGRIDEARSALIAEVKRRPERLDSWSQLFGVECLLGRYEKALAHLDVMASLDADWMMPVHIYRGLIACEKSRRDVFAGGGSPVIMGDPPAWLSGYARALVAESQGQFEEALTLREQSWEETPAFACKVDDKECEWLADDDPRLGPILEIFVEGTYYWVPFGGWTELSTQKPAFITDLLWLPSRIVLANGTPVNGYIPTRYVGTEDVNDAAVRLGHTTQWPAGPGGVSRRGLGQRCFTSNIGDFSLLEIRKIVGIS